MTYETIAGPLSRVICCLVAFAWLPVLAITYVLRRGWRNREN
jgi:hypothetical protein